MKKVAVLLFVLFLSACNISKYRNVENLVAITTPVNTQTPQPTFTPSPIPTATTDYQMTAVIAQQTSDEARRVNALVTAEFEQRIQEQLRITAEAEQRNFAVLGWTQTAALTSIPLTETQQIISNTQMAQKNSLAAAQLTATWGAPTQAVAMFRATQTIKNEKLNQIIFVAVAVVICVFAIGLIVFIFRLPIVPASEPEEIEEEPEPQETIIQMKKDNGGGDFSQTRYAIPCSPAQLTYIAEQITQGIKTLSINQWEDKDAFKGIAYTGKKRDIIMRFRRWLMENRETSLAFGTDDGQLAPTDDLFALLIGWLEGRGLPTGYAFDPTHSPDDDGSPVHGETPAKSSISMNLLPMNGKNNGGGGVSSPESVVV